jgi:hypothetical protein
LISEAMSKCAVDEASGRFLFAKSMSVQFQQNNEETWIRWLVCARKGQAGTTAAPHCLGYRGWDNCMRGRASAWRESCRAIPDARILTRTQTLKPAMGWRDTPQCRLSQRKNAVGSNA